MTISGGLTVDRWIHNLDLNLALVLTSYTAMSVGSGYALSIQSLFITLFLQGALETWIVIGMTNRNRLSLIIPSCMMCISLKNCLNLKEHFVITTASILFWCLLFPTNKRFILLL